MMRLFLSNPFKENSPVKKVYIRKREILFTALLLLAFWWLFFGKAGNVQKIKLPDGTTLHFPRRYANGPSDDALFEGKLTLKDGCLRVIGDHDKFGLLVVWPRSTTVRIDDDGMIEVLNSKGQVLARAGESVRLGGGGGGTERGGYMKSFELVIRGLPIRGCPEPYWIASDEVPQPIEDSE
jgi:hypothetical protein